MTRRCVGDDLRGGQRHARDSVFTFGGGERGGWEDRPRGRRGGERSRAYRGMWTQGSPTASERDAGAQASASVKAG